MRVPPKSMSRKRQYQALMGEVRPTTKPDLDNLLKSVKDALNGVAYVDDSQIVTITAEKAYGEQPKTIIQVTALAEP